MNENLFYILRTTIYSNENFREGLEKAVAQTMKNDVKFFDASKFVQKIMKMTEEEFQKFIMMSTTDVMTIVENYRHESFHGLKGYHDINKRNQLNPSTSLLTKKIFWKKNRRKTKRLLLDKTSVFPFDVTHEKVRLLFLAFEKCIGKDPLSDIISFCGTFLHRKKLEEYMLKITKRFRLFSPCRGNLCVGKPNSEPEDFKFSKKEKQAFDSFVLDKILTPISDVISVNDVNDVTNVKNAANTTNNMPFNENKTFRENLSAILNERNKPKNVAGQNKPVTSQANKPITSQAKSNEDPNQHKVSSNHAVPNEVISIKKEDRSRFLLELLFDITKSNKKSPVGVTIPQTFRDLFTLIKYDGIFSYASNFDDNNVLQMRHKFDQSLLKLYAFQLNYLMLNKRSIIFRFLIGEIDHHFYERNLKEHNNNDDDAEEFLKRTNLEKQKKEVVGLKITTNLRNIIKDSRDEKIYLEIDKIKQQPIKLGELLTNQIVFPISLSSHEIGETYEEELTKKLIYRNLKPRKFRLKGGNNFDVYNSEENSTTFNIVHENDITLLKNKLPKYPFICHEILESKNIDEFFKTTGIQKEFLNSDDVKIQNKDLLFNSLQYCLLGEDIFHILRPDILRYETQSFLADKLLIAARELEHDLTHKGKEQLKSSLNSFYKTELITLIEKTYLELHNMIEKDLLTNIETKSAAHVLKEMDKISTRQTSNVQKTEKQNNNNSFGSFLSILYKTEAIQRHEMIMNVQEGVVFLNDLVFNFNADEEKSELIIIFRNFVYTIMNNVKQRLSSLHDDIIWFLQQFKGPFLIYLETSYFWKVSEPFCNFLSSKFLPSWNSGMNNIIKNFKKTFENFYRKDGVRFVSFRLQKEYFNTLVRFLDEKNENNDVLKNLSKIDSILVFLNQPPEMIENDDFMNSYLKLKDDYKTKLMKIFSSIIASKKLDTIKIFETSYEDVHFEMLNNRKYFGNHYEFVTKFKYIVKRALDFMNQVMSFNEHSKDYHYKFSENLKPIYEYTISPFFIKPKIDEFPKIKDKLEDLIEVPKEKMFVDHAFCSEEVGGKKGEKDLKRLDVLNKYLDDLERDKRKKLKSEDLRIFNENRSKEQEELNKKKQIDNETKQKEMEEKEDKKKIRMDNWRKSLQKMNKQMEKYDEDEKYRQFILSPDYIPSSYSNYIMEKFKKHFGHNVKNELLLETISDVRNKIELHINEIISIDEIDRTKFITRIVEDEVYKKIRHVYEHPKFKHQLLKNALRLTRGKVKGSTTTRSHNNMGLTRRRSKTAKEKNKLMTNEKSETS